MPLAIRLSASLGLFALIAHAGALAAPQPGPFSHANGYFLVAGDQGRITELRLDAGGQGNYGSNTVAAGGHFGVSVDGAPQTAPGAQWEVLGNNLYLTGLPDGSLAVSLIGDRLTATFSFSGSHAIATEWDLVWENDGFYQQATGQNYGPDVVIDIPFRSFFNYTNGAMRPIEMFKRNAGTPFELGWSPTYCRARGASDAIVTATHAGTSIYPESNKLTLRQQATLAGQVTVTVDVRPRADRVVLQSGRPLPEFYVRPQREIGTLFDPNLTHDADDLINDFFHHMTYWWGPLGTSGGIWTDWGMMAGCFIGGPYQDFVRGSVTNWIIGEDGYGNDGYAYTWGTERGWPFPGGRDTRHFNTNAIFITALARYMNWTADTDLLNSRLGDRTIGVDYGGGNVAQFPAWNYPTQLQPGQTLGQSFTANQPFSGVATLNPTWGDTGGAFTLTLYDEAGGTQIASQRFTDVANNSWNWINFAQQPAGEYYIEISDVLNTIGWWGNTGDAYDGGVAYTDGIPVRSQLDRARLCWDYMENVLLAASNHQLVMGPNIGSSDHLGRNDDVGSNYYDILPFGYHDAMTDLMYYQAVRGMADVEDWAGNRAIARAIRLRLPDVRDTYDATYWRTGLDRNDNARYIGTVDVNDTDWDLGYTFINTMALEAGLAEGRPDRPQAIFAWLDTGESRHSQAQADKKFRIDYSDGEVFYNAPDNDPDHFPIALDGAMEQRVFARKPFTSIAAKNPTWNTSDSSFKLQLLNLVTRAVIAERTVTNAVDNAYNTLTFAEQPAGHYVLRISDEVGQIGWWASEWSRSTYARWVFAPRVSTLDNQVWWQAAVGGDPASPSFSYRWDRQLQNGGADLYESGFDVIARATTYSADSAWERYAMILRRFADPDRLTGTLGWYGEAPQGGSLGAGSVGWVWSEFPETGVLGAAFFRGFFGIESSVRGVTIHPNIPTGHGITTVGARNIAFMGAMFDLEATTDQVTVSCTDNPDNTTFHMTGQIQRSGTFTEVVELVDGEMMIGLNPVDPTRAGEAWTELR